MAYNNNHNYPPREPPPAIGPEPTDDDDSDTPPVPPELPPAPRGPPGHPGPADPRRHHSSSADRDRGSRESKDRSAADKDRHRHRKPRPVPQGTVPVAMQPGPPMPQQGRHSDRDRGSRDARTDPRTMDPRLQQDRERRHKRRDKEAAAMPAPVSAKPSSGHSSKSKGVPPPPVAGLVANEREEWVHDIAYREARKALLEDVKKGHLHRLVSPGQKASKKPRAPPEKLSSGEREKIIIETAYDQARSDLLSDIRKGHHMDRLRKVGEPAPRSESVKPPSGSGRLGGGPMVPIMPIMPGQLPRKR